MSTLTALARAIAVGQQAAQPITTVRHVHISARPLVFVPLALAGEANAPLTALIGDDPRAPRLLTVAEPRDRDQRFAFAAELAAIVIPYIERHFTNEETVGGKEPRTRYADPPQLVLPNAAGVAFTRLLGRSTRFRRTEGPWAVPESVPALGRWLTFFAERSDHPASSLTLSLTDALAQHWATGQSPIEDRNLASLLGWIDPPDGLTGAEAALLAEDPVRCPPAGPATDPTFDNEVLESLLLAIRTAKMTGDGQAMHRAKIALDHALTGQLAPTWRLMWRALQLLKGIPAGAHVPARWDQDKDVFAAFAAHLRDGGPPQPRNDGAVSAARRLASLERLQAIVAVQRAFDDPLVMAEYRMIGEAFAGRVVAAEPDRVDLGGAKRVLRPYVTVETSDIVLIGPGAVLTSPARPAQEARVVSITPSGDRTHVLLELRKGMGRALTPTPGSVPELGEAVCYAGFNDGYQRLPDFPALEDTPWTHGGPPQPYIPAEEEATEAWS